MWSFPAPLSCPSSATHLLQPPNPPKSREPCLLLASILTASERERLTDWQTDFKFFTLLSDVGLFWVHRALSCLCAFAHAVPLPGPLPLPPCLLAYVPVIPSACSLRPSPGKPSLTVPCSPSQLGSYSRLQTGITPPAPLAARRATPGSGSILAALHDEASNFLFPSWESPEKTWRDVISHTTPCLKPLGGFSEQLGRNPKAYVWPTML